MKFNKYQGTGNDFVMIDASTVSGMRLLTKLDIKWIQNCCHRRFGVGSDGLIFLKKHPNLDFEMVFFNPDGSQSFCGNGSRCAVAFARHLGWVQGETCRFLAIDGGHEARIFPKNKHENWVEIAMSKVSQIQKNADHAFILNTGSPHFVQILDSLEGVNIVEVGRRVRYSQQFEAEGINVNVVAINQEGIEMLTYERGVEDETLSCGTGTTAAALAAHQYSGGKSGNFTVSVATRGGKLQVRFESDGQGNYSNIWLCGPAIAVFTGNF